jgi:hypothetical protein
MQPSRHKSGRRNTISLSDVISKTIHGGSLSQQSQQYSSGESNPPSSLSMSAHKKRENSQQESRQLLSSRALLSSVIDTSRSESHPRGKGTDFIDCLVGGNIHTKMRSLITEAKEEVLAATSTVSAKVPLRYSTTVLLTVTHTTTPPQFDVRSLAASKHLMGFIFSSFSERSLSYRLS